ncbi:MFS transporter [Agreia sp. Leaf283]|uniref:MFS transporter n=1 Tax=Agreia sp. Leaf283 TaxID=1736321 RepID=UPI00351055BE
MTPPPSDPFPVTAPMPVLASAPPWRDTFSSLRVPNFRLFTSANIVAMTALWIQRIAQDWLVLELSGSVAAVGITVALQFAPMLFLGLYGGVLVDRYSKRMLLAITQSVSLLASVALAVLALTGVVEVWHIMLVALIVGLATVIDNPTRQVFVNELVGPKYLRNAISLNSSVFQLGALIGPAIGGVLLVSVGAGWSFAINALACLGVVITVLMLNPKTLYPAPVAPRAKGQLREGLSYVFAKPTILWTVVMVAFVAVFALNMPVLLAAYASDVFDTGPGGYGLFNSLVAVGALAGAVLSTRRTSIRLRAVVITGLAWGIVQAIVAGAPSELVVGILLVFVGFCTLQFLTGANQLIQLSSNVSIRGRVMSVYVLVLLGGQALGGPLMGWLVESYGPQFGMLVSGVVPAVAALIVGIVLARSGRLTVRLRRRLPLVAIVQH